MCYVFENVTPRFVESLRIRFLLCTIFCFSLQKHKSMFATGTDAQREEDSSLNS